MLEALRDRRSEAAARAARLSSDLVHLEETCMQDLAVPADELRADETMVRLEAEPLAGEEEGCRRHQAEARVDGASEHDGVGGIQEASQRHDFLETQRKDLIDSIENTQNSIREIEVVCASNSKKPSLPINENFSACVYAFVWRRSGIHEADRSREFDDSGIESSLPLQERNCRISFCCLVEKKR